MPHKGFKHSEESKRKMSKAAKGRKFSLELLIIDDMKCYEEDLDFLL